METFLTVSQATLFVKTSEGVWNTSLGTVFASLYFAGPVARLRIYATRFHRSFSFIREPQAGMPVPFPPLVILSNRSLSLRPVIVADSLKLGSLDIGPRPSPVLP